MKHILLTTIAAVVLVGCGPSASERALIDAAYAGNVEAVKQHLAAGTDVNAWDKYGSTPLHKAALKGHKEIVGLLIAKGADVNAKDKTRGETPLHYAAINGHKELAELLIDSGAEVNAKNVRGTTPLGCTIRHPETAALLRKHGGISGAAESIHSVVALGDIETIKQRLEAGTDVNVKDPHGGTPLHRAAMNGHKEIAELLIAKGADVNAKNKFDSTPLDWAIRGKHAETADLLRKHGGKTGEELKAEGK